MSKSVGASLCVGYKLYVDAEELKIVLDGIECLTSISISMMVQ